MGSQRTFAGVAWSAKKKVTRRERFLAEMNAVIPWKDLVTVIAPHYPKPPRGRPPMALETMLRICFLQQWFDVSDPAAEDALYESESMRRFVGLELSEDAGPDETTILHFRHLLEQHRLTERLFDAVRGLLETKGLLVQAGTIVDATIIHQRAELDEERDRHAGSGDEADPRGEHVALWALWHEGARRDGAARAGPQRDHHACGGRGDSAVAPLAPR